MTEYDFSPEAYDAYIQKQVKISNWVDNTYRYPPANPFITATPTLLDRPFPQTQFRTSVRRPLSRQRVWDEEDALQMGRPRRERRASDSEQGGQIGSRFWQGLGDPSEGLSSQSGERRSLERSQERAEGEKRRRAEEKKRRQIEEEKLRRQAEEKLRRQVEEEKLRREAAEEKLHRVEAKLLQVEEKLRRAEE